MPVLTSTHRGTKTQESQRARGTIRERTREQEQAQGDQPEEVDALDPEGKMVRCAQTGCACSHFWAVRSSFFVRLYGGCDTHGKNYATKGRWRNHVLYRIVYLDTDCVIVPHPYRIVTRIRMNETNASVLLSLWSESRRFVLVVTNNNNIRHRNNCKPTTTTTTRSSP